MRVHRHLGRLDLEREFEQPDRCSAATTSATSSPSWTRYGSAANRVTSSTTRSRCPIARVWFGTGAVLSLRIGNAFVPNAVVLLTGVFVFSAEATSEIGGVR